MPAAASSPIPAVVLKLGPMDTGAGRRPAAVLRCGARPALAAGPVVLADGDPAGLRLRGRLRSEEHPGDRRMGRERPRARLLTAIGIRRHPLRWRRAPSPATIGRVLRAVNGDVLDRAVGAYLADRHRGVTEWADASGPRRVIAVDGKALKGSARRDAPRRHLLSAVTHRPVVTLAQAEVGTKTNETTHFKPLLAPLALADDLVTFDALHSVKANITWLVETKNAHYIAVIKTNQPTAYRQLAVLPWPGHRHPAHRLRDRTRPPRVPVDQDLRHRRRTRRHRLPPRPPWPSGSTAAAGNRPTRKPRERLRRHQPRRPPDEPSRTGRRDPRALGSGELLAPHPRCHLRRGRLHRPHRHRTPRHGHLPQPRHRHCSKLLGADNIAKTTRAIRDEPERALPILGIINNPDPQGT